MSRVPKRLPNVPLSPTARETANALNYLLTVADFTSLTNAANDAAAATAGVSIGELYRNGSVVMVRVA